MPSPSRGCTRCSRAEPQCASFGPMKWLLASVLALALPGCPSKEASDKGNKDEEGSSKKKTKDDKGKGDDEGGTAEVDPFAKDHLAIAKKIACGDSPLEPWCTAAKGFAKATRAKLPDTGTLLGVTTFVQTKGASAETFEKHLHLSSAAFKNDGDDSAAFIAQVKPDSASEQKEVQRLTDLLFDAFAGKKVTLDPNAGLRGYLDGLPKKAKYALEKHEGGYKVAGGAHADLRKVGKYWVAVEIPPKDPAGIWWSVFSTQAYE